MNSFDVYYKREIDGYDVIKSTLTGDPFNFVWSGNIEPEQFTANVLAQKNGTILATRNIPPKTVFFRSNKYTTTGTIRQKRSRNPDTFEFLEFRKVNAILRTNYSRATQDSLAITIPPLHFQGVYWFEALMAHGSPKGAFDHPATFEEIVHSAMTGPPFIMGAPANMTVYNSMETRLSFLKSQHDYNSSGYALLNAYLEAPGKTQIDKMLNTLWLTQPNIDKQSILRLRSKMGIPLSSNDANDAMMGGLI